MEEFNHFSHNHGLVFHQMPQGSKIRCSSCKLTGLGNSYVCWECNHFLHEQCFQATQSLEHRSHTRHPLTLVPYPTYSSGSFLCNSCNIEGNGLAYTCSECQFDMHVHCALLPNVKPNAKHKPQNHVSPPIQNSLFPSYPLQNDPQNGSPQNPTYPLVPSNTSPDFHPVNTMFGNSGLANHNRPQFFPPNAPMRNCSLPVSSPFTNPSPTVAVGSSTNQQNYMSPHFPQPNPYPSNYGPPENAPPFPQQNLSPPNYGFSVSAPPFPQPSTRPNYGPSMSTPPFPQPGPPPPPNYEHQVCAPSFPLPNPSPPNYDPPKRAPSFPQPNPPSQNNGPLVSAPPFPQSNPPPPNYDPPVSDPPTMSNSPPQNDDPPMNTLHFPPQNLGPSVTSPCFPQQNPHVPNSDHPMSAPHFPQTNLPPPNYGPSVSAPSFSQSSQPPPNNDPPPSVPHFPPPNLPPPNYNPPVSALSFPQLNSPPSNYGPKVSAPTFPQPNRLLPNYGPLLSAPLDSNPSTQHTTTIPAYSTIANPTTMTNPAADQSVHAKNPLSNSTWVTEHPSHPHALKCMENDLEKDNSCISWPETVTRPDHEHNLTLYCTSSTSETSQEATFICDACKNPVHGRAWIYYCSECNFGTHLECVVSEMKQETVNATKADGQTEEESKREMELKFARLQIIAEGSKAALDNI